MGPFQATTRTADKPRFSSTRLHMLHSLEHALILLSEASHAPIQAAEYPEIV